jgi:Mn-dependent DtxR family transcriptional regulator
VPKSKGLINVPSSGPNRNLTTTQERALVAYRQLTDQNGGEPPTVKQLADCLGVSRNPAYQLMQRLREKGYLSMKPVTIIRPTLTAKGRKAK